MVDILLVEHPPNLRRMLRARLTMESDVTIIGEADDGATAISLAQTLRPAVILLDAEMPHLDLAHVVAAVGNQSPTSRIVVLSLHTGVVARSLNSGSAILVSKHEGIPGLLNAIRHEGEQRSDQ